MSDDRLVAASEPARLMHWGGVTTIAGLLLILAQLLAEVFSHNRFGPTYIGLLVVIIGAVLMGLACVAGLVWRWMPPRPTHEPE